MKKITILFFAVALFVTSQINTGYSQQIVDTSKIYGVTIDDFSGIDTICASLHNHCKKMTVRIAIDEHLDTADYREAIDSIHTVAFMMGEIFDSYFTDSFTITERNTKAERFLNAFEDKVDIWEVGNEINGEWLGEPDSVVAKISSIYSLVKNRGHKTALTLFYNKMCTYNPPNEMFYWVNNYLPDSLKNGIDYLLVSYYEDSCNNDQPDWQQVFDSLHTIFPNSKLGMGECGTENEANKDEFITRYYNMNIATPNYIGGYFWWYYKHDGIPYTNPHWNTINNAICTSGVNEIKTKSREIYNYPNPFNTSSTICFTLDKKEEVNISVYNSLGQQLFMLLNAEKNSGKHEIVFDAGSLKSGTYLYKIQTDSFVETRVMILNK